MNSKTTIIGLVAAIAVLSGAMGLSVTGAFSDQTIAQTTIPATGFLMGQVMIEAHNADGELIAYRLGDNEVVDDGEQCILKMLFGTTQGLRNTDLLGRGQYASDTNCSGVLTGAWDVIAIGTSGVSTSFICDVSGNNVFDETCADAAYHDVLTIMGDELTAGNSVAGLARDVATTKTWTNGTGTTDTTIVLKKTFTATGVTAAVKESGLFNSTTVSGSGMLAHKTFANVALAAGDSITVQWTFTVGN
jgi:hypothetical protein